MTTKKSAPKNATKVQLFVKFFYDMPAELNRDDMLVYGYIANRCSLKDKMSTATVPTMARTLRMSVSTVKRSIRKLIDMGLVELVYSGQEKRVASHYVVHPYMAQTEPRLGSHRAGLGSHRAGLGSHRAGTRVSQSHRIDGVVDVSVDVSGDGVVDSSPEHPSQRQKRTGKKVKKEKRVQEPTSASASEPDGSSAPATILHSEKDVLGEELPEEINSSPAIPSTVAADAAPSQPEGDHVPPPKTGWVDINDVARFLIRVPGTAEQKVAKANEQYPTYSTSTLFDMMETIYPKGVPA